MEACLEFHPDYRPSASDVIEVLDKVLQDVYDPKKRLVAMQQLKA